MYKVKGTLSVLSGRKDLKGVTHKLNPIGSLTLVNIGNGFFHKQQTCFNFKHSLCCTFSFKFSVVTMLQ